EKGTGRNETFCVRLSQPSWATLADAEGQGTIRNDDKPAISVANVSLIEGNSGTTYAVFTLSLSVPTTQQVTVNFATANGTATAGSDYTARSGAVTFAPGVTAQTVSVAVTGDTLVESDETFKLLLSSPVNGRGGEAAGAGEDPQGGGPEGRGGERGTGGGTGGGGGRGARGAPPPRRAWHTPPAGSPGGSTDHP